MSVPESFPTDFQKFFDRFFLRFFKEILYKKKLEIAIFHRDFYISKEHTWYAISLVLLANYQENKLSAIMNFA